MLIPVYLRGSSYYLHTRINGAQFKRSLQTNSKSIAIMRASRLMDALMNIDLANIRTYEINLQSGVVKAEGIEDHARLMEALTLLKSSAAMPPAAFKEEPSASRSGLSLMELLDKYLILKTVKPATVTALTNTAKEFSAFYKSKFYITNILVSDIARYQEHLASKKNVPRTIDGKVGYLKTLLNFAIKQGYLIGKNPAGNMNLMTKKQKLTSGYATFELHEIVQIFSSPYLKAQKLSDPDYYYVLLIGLLSGCRISEVTSLKSNQFQMTAEGANYIIIRDAKTHAGKREVPLPAHLFQNGFADFLQGKSDSIFKYAPREGKGSGNAVGKKFKRHLEQLNITRDKLVFHSIRKFVNDFFMKNGVEFEPRCQVIGHEIDSVNVATYSKKYSAQQLSELVNPIQMKIISQAGI